MSVLRVGLVSAATYGYMGAPRTPGSHHGTAFAASLNGYDQAKRRRYEWTFIDTEKRIADARVVKVWDPVTEWAQRLADVCDIPEVCASPEDCAEGVDAVIIIDDGSGEHSRYAIEPLKRGIPTFCDKPLAMTAGKAKQIADLATETGTPFMSASSLRFVPDILALREETADLGNISLVTAVCGNELVYYGIHALSMVYAVLGRGAVSCMNVGRPGRDIVRVRFATGTDVVLMVAEREYMHPGYQIGVYGVNGWRIVQPDLTELYWYLLVAFMKLVRGGEVLVPLDEEVEVIAALEAGKRSLEEGREVSIAEVLD